MAFAAAAQATTGFGFALVGVPLLTLAADPQTAVVTITTVNLVLVAMIAIRVRAHIEWRSAAVITGTSLFGIPLGLYVLVRNPQPRRHAGTNPAERGHRIPSMPPVPQDRSHDTFELDSAARHPRHILRGEGRRPNQAVPTTSGLEG